MKLLITAPTFAPSLDGPTFLGGNSFADLEEDNARAVVAAGKGLYIDGKDDKTKLRTNKSHEDLIIKAEVPGQLNKIDSHKNKDKNPKKSSIKPHKVDHNQMTGIENFT